MLNVTTDDCEGGFQLMGSRGQAHRPFLDLFLESGICFQHFLVKGWKGNGVTSRYGFGGQAQLFRRILLCSHCQNSSPKGIPALWQNQYYLPRWICGSWGQLRFGSICPSQGDGFPSVRLRSADNKGPVFMDMFNPYYK